MKYTIVRSIRESFEVEADSFDEAVDKIQSGEVQESFDLGETFEQVES